MKRTIFIKLIRPHPKSQGHTTSIDDNDSVTTGNRTEDLHAKMIPVAAERAFLGGKKASALWLGGGNEEEIMGDAEKEDNPREAVIACIALPISSPSPAASAVA